MDSHERKRNKVTDEHREEARRLRAIWAERKEALVARGVGTQEKFGERYEIGNQAATGFFLNGKVALSLKAAHGFARGLGCSIEEFSPRLARLVTGAADERFVDRFSVAALELAEQFDAVPAQRKRALYALLLDEIRRASTDRPPAPDELPMLSRRADPKTAPDKSRA